MLSLICWAVAIIALANAARLKHNQVKQAKRFSEMHERGLIAAARLNADREEKALAVTEWRN